MTFGLRVHVCEPKVLSIPSAKHCSGLPRSGKSQGILLKVRENLRSLLKSMKSQGIIFSDKEL